MPNLIIVVAAVAAIAAIVAAYWLIELRARLKFERWKAVHTQSISREAIKGSQAAVAGRVLERFAPHMPGFGYNPKDVRFIGDPVDFVLFDGLSDGNVRRVVFVEVKTGSADLNGNERKVKSAIVERRVEWSLFRVPNGQPAVPDAEPQITGGVRSKALDTALQHLPASLLAGGSALRERGRF